MSDGVQYKRKVLEPGEFDMLLEYAPLHLREDIRSRDLLALVLLHDLALRCFEMCHLRADQFTYGRTEVAVHGKGSRWHQGAKLRILPVSDRVREYMDLHGVTSGELIGCDTSRYRRLIPRLGEEILGKYVHPHMLRHTRITELALDKAVPLPIVQEFARHDSLATTERYIHLRKDWMDDIRHAL